MKEISLSEFAKESPPIIEGVERRSHSFFFFGVFYERTGFSKVGY